MPEAEHMRWLIHVGVIHSIRRCSNSLVTRAKTTTNQHSRATDLGQPSAAGVGRGLARCWALQFCKLSYNHLDITNTKRREIMRLRSHLISILLVASVMLTPHLLYAVGDEVMFLKVSSGTFDHPHDLALGPSNQYLYVADLGNHVVKVLDPFSLKTLGVIGKGELTAPHDVAFDRMGRLLVADSGNDRIAIYKVDGAKATYEAELRGGLGSPEGVTSDSRGVIYVTNTGLHSVLAFKHGKKINALGSHGPGARRFVRPHDIEFSLDGQLYVSDPGNNRIQILSPSLDVVGTFRGDGADFHEPKYMAIDEGDWLYVADQLNHQVKVFNRFRKSIATIGTGKAGKGSDQLDGPEGVEARIGHIWISDTHNDRIVLYKWKPPVH
ncbi:MAG TPA: hypothetical protein EYM83_08025 [Nitrospirales bacterium]|nr:hypothetical protein [Nitrospirales bacterium]